MSENMFLHRTSLKIESTSRTYGSWVGSTVGSAVGSSDGFKVLYNKSKHVSTIMLTEEYIAK